LVKDIPGNWYDAMTWIGGKYEWMMDDWFWVDGAPFSYTNWRWNEPNNYSGDEYCVEMYKGGFKSPGKWNDYPCYTKMQSFVCRASSLKFHEDN
ncbi:lectin C-type domain protein, partial [Ostertagia ostertagi]